MDKVIPSTGPFSIVYSDEKVSLLPEQLEVNIRDDKVDKGSARNKCGFGMKAAPIIGANASARKLRILKSGKALNHGDQGDHGELKEKKICEEDLMYISLNLLSVSLSG